MIRPVKTGMFKSFLNLDWYLTISILLLSSAGLSVMYSLSSENLFFDRQIIWLSISLALFLIFSLIDWSFLKNSRVVLIIFLTSIVFLILILLIGDVTKGAERWLNFGFFSFQPSDPAKIALIILLAKYFSKRHIEIAHLKHVVTSGFYAFMLSILIFMQPDLSSAIIIFVIWLGMVMVSGISKKHILAVLLLAIVSFILLWFFVLHDYQKQRIISFINPLADIRGAGYNALQSVIAVGSGQVFGKGIGFGTQSRLRFLPEYQTDFIFAAFAEEWGFIGVIILITLFGIIFWRIIKHSLLGTSNFETLFGLGIAVWLISHFTIHIGMNIGILPVTGITLPFLSYGGSHLLTEFTALGIFMGMCKKNKIYQNREDEDRTLV